jgi:AAA15 family ATPase/GTPase
MENFIYIAFSIPKELCEDFQNDKDTDNFLNNELKEHIQTYKNQIKNRECYKYENMPNLQHKNVKFKINEININYQKRFIDYFWALEDGEIIIQKKSYIVKQGDIIIFPNSWVFSYEINFKYIN